VNDKYFDFRRYQFKGVDLDDVEDPDLMEELFPEKFSKKKPASLLPQMFSEDELPNETNTNILDMTD
jgi:hypothetical protein